MLTVSHTFSGILVGWTTDGVLDQPVAWNGTPLVISFSIALSIPRKKTLIRIRAFVFWIPWCPIYANFTGVLWKISGKTIQLSVKMISLSRFIVRVSLNFLYRFNKFNVSLSNFSFSRRFQSLFSILWCKFCKNLNCFVAAEISSVVNDFGMVIVVTKLTYFS